MKACKKGRSRTEGRNVTVTKQRSTSVVEGGVLAVNLQLLMNEQRSKRLYGV